MTLQQYLPYIYRFLALALLIGIIFVFRDKVLTSLLPFLVAFVLADLIEPAVQYINAKLRIGRSFAVMIVLAALLTVGGYAAAKIASIIYEEVQLAGAQATTLQRDLLAFVADLLERLTAAAENELFPVAVADAIEARISSLSEQAASFLTDTVVPFLTKALTNSVPWFLLISVITMIATYFISLDRNHISQSILMLAPKRWRVAATLAQERILDDLVRFIRAQIIIIVLITTVAALGLYLMNVRFWLTMAIIIGVLDAIPAIGPGIILGPWALVALLMGDVATPIYLAILYVVIFVAHQILQAKVLGESIGVHPLLMLFAIYGGIVMFGTYGLIIGPLLVIICRALLGAGVLQWPSRDEEEESTEVKGSEGA